MGLIRAVLAGTNTMLKDQWKEYFSCDALSNDVLVAKGVMQGKKRGLFGARNKATTDIITNGSVISVNEGQVALIIDNGKIVDFCAEVGMFTWDTSSEPSMFEGGFFKGLGESFKRVGHRFTFGGDAGSQQRVYYINTKEIMGNKFGTTTPMPYDDPYYKTALYLRYFGQYSFKVTDPLLFFSNISGNVKESYTREQLRDISTDEFMTALDTTLAMCSTSGFKFSQLPMKQREIAKFMSDTLDAEWKNNRGIEIMSVALAKVTPDDTSRERIEEFDTNMMHSDPTAMTGGLAYAQMKAMRDAASNEGGAMTGFMGFGMAANAMGGVGNQGTLINTAKDLAKENENKTNESHANDDKVREADDQGNTLTCACGHVFEGKFCPECGMPAPAPKDTWLCPSCGRSCTGKFCRECGTKEPVDETWACPACKRECKGKFCPDCGAKRP